jgi:hypothetical protein
MSEAVIRRLLATLDAERARREAAEVYIEKLVTVLGVSAFQGTGPGAQLALGLMFDARAAWLAAKEAPATPAPAPLGDDRGEG